MDRTQATEIQKHLLDAADAVAQASGIIFTLDQEDRAMLGVPLGKVESALHFELLRAVYVRYPDLRPPAEEMPVVDTTRRWEDIVLPQQVSEADLDSIIFSVMNSRWQKTAMVIVQAHERCEELALPIDTEVLGLRILALAETDRLDSQGNIRKWRHSEVRLKS